jgi:membrane protein YqaA with SNARE-associated domain
LDQIARQLFAILAALGGFGLFGAGIITSFILVPFASDLMMVGMTARNNDLLLYYAAMAAAGSVSGSLLLDLIFRKGGESKLAKHLPPRRFDYIKRKVSSHAGPAIVIAALAPPPFPYSPFIMAAAALQYPRVRLLVIIGVSRLVRYLIVGLLAIRFGQRILQLAEHPAVHIAVILLIVLAVAGSVVSIYKWVKRSRNVQPSSSHSG